MEELLEVISAFINADSWRESQRILEQHPELLYPEVDFSMRILARSQKDERAKRVIEKHRVLLARCREIGIEQAFSEVMRPAQPEPESLLDRLMAAASGGPEQLHAVLANYQRLPDVSDPLGAGPVQSSGQSSEIMAPPGFEADLAEVQRLQIQSERDPRFLKRVIQIYHSILERLPPHQHWAFRAATYYNLGLAYSMLPIGDRSENLGRAITCYQESLRFWTPETAPFHYALTQISLGEAYHNLPISNRAKSLAQAIDCYRTALRFFTPQTTPSDYAQIQNSLGNVYADMLTGDRARNLAQAIECYREALRFQTPAAAPFGYAQTQNNLGTVYADLQTGDREENLRQAIECYKEALRFRTPEAKPLGYAETQNNLGLAYASLPTGDRDENLRRAIECYKEALCFYTPEATPIEYAMTQHNLGLAYTDLWTGDQNANLARAIECFREALRFWTPEDAPFDYALAQNCLGSVFHSLQTGDRAENLAQAITCYQEALRFYTPEAAPIEYAMVQCNLGSAYANLVTADRVKRLGWAIECYQEALRFQTPETAPLRYAIIQYNLGNAYAELGNLPRATECYQEALRFHTSETAPLSYAKLQSSLGNVYAELQTGDRAENLVRAKECYHEALRFRTPEISLHDYRLTKRRLADLYFHQETWDSALAAYSAALDAGERLYRTGLFAESKAIEVAQNATLYHHAAFAAARLGHIDQALLILERGKTRLLTEAWHLRAHRPTGVPNQVWRAFEQAGANVRAIQTRETILPDQEHNSVQAYAIHERAAREANAALDMAIKEVRKYAPIFLKELDLAAVQALVPDKQTALVTFCLTDQGSIGFIISQNQVKPVRMVTISEFTRPRLRQLLLGSDAERLVTGGWMGDYLSRDDNRWRATMEQVLSEVGEKLIAPIIAALSTDIKRLILLPSGGLSLLPLHAAPLSRQVPNLVCDRYQVIYAPSAGVLSNIQAKLTLSTFSRGECNSVGETKSAIGRSLYLVINPQEDPHLPFASIEGRALAQLFSNRQVHRGKVATKEEIIAGLQGQSYLHFCCHGTYDWNSPSQSGMDLANGRLTLADLQSGTIDISGVQLVTLSACETGVTDVAKGSPDEYVGLAAGFMLAGVPNVVSSLWTVPDLSTSLLMERFYGNHLHRNMDLAAALHEAQLWVRDLGVEEVVTYVEGYYRQANDKGKVELLKYTQYYRHLARQDSTQRPFAHPYYWAAFTLSGTGSVRKGGRDL